MNTRVGILACYKSSATVLWSTINAIWSDSLDCILNCILSIDWNTSQTQNTPIEIHQAANQVHALQQIVIMLSARDCCQYEWSHSSPILGRGSKRLKLRCNDCKQGHLTAIISPIIMKFIDDNLTNIHVQLITWTIFDCHAICLNFYPMLWLWRKKWSVSRSINKVHACFCFEMTGPGSGMTRCMVSQWYGNGITMVW